MVQFNLRHKTPAFAIKKAGEDITDRLQDRLVSLELVDNRGFEADMLTLTLSDHDGKLAMPKTGEKIDVALGFKGEDLTPKGTFVVDEIALDGCPDVMTIRAKSANLMSGLANSKERSFNQQTIGDILREIAGENEMFLQVSENLRDVMIDHIDQNAESTTNFLSRLAKEYDAIATVKGDVLIFIQAGECTSASGKPLPEVAIERSSGDGFSFTLAESENYDEVQAHYYDVAKAKRGTVSVMREKVAAEIQSHSTRRKTLRHTYKSKQGAENACKRTLARVDRGKVSFSITLAQGRAEVFPEIPVKVKGFKPEIDATEWLACRVTHRIDGAGFITELELEIREKK